MLHATMGAWHHVWMFLPALLFHLSPSLAYSFKNCTMDYFEDPAADVNLNCMSRHLVEVPDDIPRCVNLLYLADNDIQSINRDDFTFFSKLRHLSLGSNQISHINDGSFNDLGALEWLNLDNNKLTQLTGNMFLGLSNLTSLNLGSNYINFIDSSAFRCLDRLQTLILELNKLKAVADLQPVFGLPNLQRLDLRGNRFTTFETKDLQLNAPSSVETLNLADNSLVRFGITTPIFPRLQYLDLSRCRRDGRLVWDITEKAFLSSITHVDFSFFSLSYNEMLKVLGNLDSLDYLTFYYMDKLISRGLLERVSSIPTLRKLDLRHNYVANMSEKLANFSQLRELDVSWTSVGDPPRGSLRAMKQLTHLRASSTHLTKVPEDVRDLPSLKVLYLDHNTINKLHCEDFANTTSLTELYLNVNFISKLDHCVFENLKDLKILDLGVNILWTMGNAFQMSLQNLEFLDLTGSHMTLITKGAFKSLGSLKYLTLTSKHINMLQGNVFEGLDNLGNLNMSLPMEFNWNLKKLKKLENLTIYYNIESGVTGSHSPNYKAFRRLKYLKYLRVECKGFHFGYPILPEMFLEALRQLEDFTAINVYPSAPTTETFNFNPQLKRLTIGMTDMSDVTPDLFLPIPNLQALDLSGTKLKDLDFLVQADLVKLKWLKLSGNELTVINQTALESLPALQYLDLSGNPFTCDCDNAAFIQWVKTNNQTQVVEAYQYICSFPLSEQGKALLGFDMQYCQQDPSYYFFVGNTCLVLLALVTSLAYHFLRWQFVYAFHLFLAFLYDGRRRKKAPQRYDAFVSYNVEDEAWVYQELLPVLEGEQGWKLCLHHRDFEPGRPIIENITDAIYGSRKTISVITQRYLQSEWCSREIQMASFRLFDEKKDVLILLFLEEIPAHQLSPYHRMRKLVKRRTYLSWPQAGQHKGVFWQNVRRALETGEDAPTEGNDLLS